MYYTPNGYIVPTEFHVHFFPRISAFSRRTKMHLNGMLLIGTDFFQNYSSFVGASNPLVKSTFFSFLQHGSKYYRNSLKATDINLEH